MTTEKLKAGTPVADYERQVLQLLEEVEQATGGGHLPTYLSGELFTRITTLLQSTAKERDAEIERLRQGLWDCARVAGEDVHDPTPCHMTFPDIVVFAIRAVETLSNDHDQLLNELPLTRADQQDAGEVT